MKWLHQHLRPLVTALSLATTLLVTGCLWDDSEGEEAATKSTLPDAVKTAFGADPNKLDTDGDGCLLYTSPSPRDRTRSRMPSSA